jgi:serine/threonine-protein kinase
VVNGLRARSESNRAVAARSFLVELFKLADPQSSRGQQMSPAEMLRIGARKALDTLGHQPDVQADVLRDIGRMQTYADEIVDADANLRLVVRMLAAQGRHREWLHAQADLADNAFDLGDLDRVELILKEIEAPVGDAGDDPALQSRFWFLKGIVSRARQRLAVAIAELNASLQLSIRAHGESAPDTVDVLRELGDAHSLRGQHEEALRLLEDALRRLKANPEAGPRDRLAVEMHLAAALVRAGRYDGLIPRFRDILDRCDRDMGPANRTASCRGWNRRRGTPRRRGARPSAPSPRVTSWRSRDGSKETSRCGCSSSRSIRRIVCRLAIEPRPCCPWPWMPW